MTPADQLREARALVERGEATFSVSIFKRPALFTFWDVLTKAEVLAAFDRAIALAEEADE